MNVLKVRRCSLKTVGIVKSHNVKKIPASCNYFIFIASNRKIEKKNVLEFYFTHVYQVSELWRQHKKMWNPDNPLIIN